VYFHFDSEKKDLDDDPEVKEAKEEDDLMVTEKKSPTFIDHQVSVTRFGDFLRFGLLLKVMRALLLGYTWQNFNVTCTLRLAIIGRLN